MLTYYQGILLGALQGVSELFPISSLGHSVILPGLLGWNINQQDPLFLMFLVATHFATALVLLGFFWKDWVRIVKGIFRSLKEREIKEGDSDAKLGWLLVVGTIPAGIIGLLLQDEIRKYFLNATSASIFLIANGIMLYGADQLRSRKEIGGNKESDENIAKLTWWQSIKIGTAQVLALIPGFSRTGSTLGGGLLAGLSNEDALRFSFLLSTPIIGAAAALELPQLFTSGNQTAIGVACAGAITAAFFAYLSVKFLTDYFSSEKKNLRPFAVYCIAAGLLALAILK